MGEDGKIGLRRELTLTFLPSEMVGNRTKRKPFEDKEHV